MRARLNVEAFLRRIYSLSGSRESWLQDVAKVLEPSFPQGVSFQACLFHLNHNESKVTTGATHVLGGRSDPELNSVFARAARAGMGQQVYPGIRRLNYTTATEARMWTPESFEIFRSAGTQDFITLVGTTSSGGIAMGTFQDRTVPQAPGSRRMWLGVGRHLQAAVTARQQLESAALETCDAVLSPDGQVIEARGVARRSDIREALRRALRAREKSKEWGAMHASDALERWRELAAGHWVLLDHFTENGQRHVLALCNAGTVAPARALTENEARALEGVALGHPYKAVAASLDISQARAHQLVGLALAKLGVADVGDLVACARSRGPRLWGQWPLGRETLAALRYPAATVEAVSDLTPAEREIARGLLTGKSYSELATERGSSRRTIANQAATLYAKLCVSGRLELVARLAR